MNWKETKINIGDLAEMKSTEITFKATSKITKIDKIIPGCKACTTVNYNEAKKELYVTLTLGQIPIHLRNKKEIPFRKTITVYYKNGNLEVLEIIGNKTRK
jgi:hypothetical protein